MSRDLTLVPAYGRDYRSKAEVMTDLRQGKDFKCCDTGQYCSIRDLEIGDRLELRYKKMTMAVVHVVKAEDLPVE